MKSEIRLARNWPMSKVRQCLDHKRKSELARFIRERYVERFFQPLQNLSRLPGNQQGYGFAIMALCCLLIETLESYRLGLPSTNYRELKNLRQIPVIPTRYRIPDKKHWPRKGGEVFNGFFVHYAEFFQGLNGYEFCDGVRNGLLHQAQTRNGWSISVRGVSLFSTRTKRINRNVFSRNLRECFEQYLVELEGASWTDQVWRNAERKIWWLLKLSQAGYKKS